MECFCRWNTQIGLTLGLTASAQIFSPENNNNNNNNNNINNNNNNINNNSGSQPQRKLSHFELRTDDQYVRWEKVVITEAR